MARYAELLELLRRQEREERAARAAAAAIDETVIPLHSPLPLVGVSIRTERGCQQNDRTLADGAGGQEERPADRDAADAEAPQGLPGWGGGGAAASPLRPGERRAAAGGGAAR